MKTIKTNKLEFYGDGMAEVIISKSDRITIEITETSGLGIIGVELTMDQAGQIANQLTKLIKEAK